MTANYATEELYTQTHTLETRDLSIENATSFIIIISIGFVAFTLLCAATSIYYRRRMLLAYPGDLQPEWATPLDPGEEGDKPQLWDVPVSESKKSTTRTNGYGKFTTIFPLAARMAALPLGHAAVAPEAPVGSTVSAAWPRRWGHRFGTLSSRGTLEAAPETSLGVEDVEVVMLINMPSASNPTSTALSLPSLAFKGDEDTHAHASEESGRGIRSDYVIGVLQTPYPREAQETAST